MADREFDPDTLPWLDRPYREIDDYVGSLGSSPERAAELRDQLIHWMRFGYLVKPGLIESELIDAYLADVVELIEHAERYSVALTIEGRPGTIAAKDAPIRDLATQHFRICDLHNSSVAGKLLALHPKIIEMLEHLFREAVVAMQTLTFIFGTEQHLHQDYAFVASGILSHLVASWIALEDVHPDAGPLGYLPGSHSIPKFDFGDGLLLTPDSDRDELDFRDHIESASKERGFPELVFEAKKGDVFLWHAALAHSGTPVRQVGLTRRSLVTHYSTQAAYPIDRRAPHEPPRVRRFGRAIVYENPALPSCEDELTIGLEKIRRSRPELLPEGM